MMGQHIKEICANPGHPDPSAFYFAGVERTFILTTLRPPRLFGFSRHSQRDVATTCHNGIPSGMTLSLAKVAPLETGACSDDIICLKFVLPVEGDGKGWMRRWDNGELGKL